MITQLIEYGWHGNLEYVLIAVSLMSYILYRSKAEIHSTLKTTILVFLLSIVGLFVSGVTDIYGYSSVAKSLYSVFFIIEGMAIIRLCGLFVFNILFPPLNINPPSILEEIIVIIAYFIWGMIQLSFAGLNLGEIITTSAVMTAIVAFAMQDTLGNTFGGLALQWDHSLKIGDWIRINDIEGKIVDISWRAIHIETRDWETVIMPNSILMKNQFKVLGKRIGEPSQWRRWIWFNIEYSIPPNKVIQVAESAMEIADIPHIADNPKPNCMMMNYDDSVARYALRYWLTDFAVDAPVDSMVRQHLYLALKREGLMPSIPQQHIVLTKENEKHQKHQHELEVNHRTEILKNIHLFTSFNSEELHYIAESLTFFPYAKGDIISNRGEIDHALRIIISGEAELSIDYKGQKQSLLTLKKGDFFGEMGLMTGKPRAGTVQAITDLECYTLKKPALEHIIHSRPEIVNEMHDVMIARKDKLEQVLSQMDILNDQAKNQHQNSNLLNNIKHFFGIK